MVILLMGACQAKPGETVPADCTGGMSKEEFEKLTKALDPEMPDMQKRTFASRLGQLIVSANEARRRGLDKSPEYQLMQRLVAMQALDNLLRNDVRTKAAAVPDADVQAYYKEHVKDYQTGTFQKIFIPNRIGTKEHPAAPEEDKAFAEKIRERWMAGEDPEKLQKEATERVDPKGIPPKVDLTSIAGRPYRRVNLQPDQDIFDMAPGSFSPLKSNAIGHYVYKVLTIGALGLDDKVAGEFTVRDQIKQMLQQQRMRSMAQDISTSSIVKLNDKYFGPEPQRPTGMPPGIGGAPAGVRMTPPPPPPAKPGASPRGAQKPK